MAQISNFGALASELHNKVREPCSVSPRCPSEPLLQILVWCDGNSLAMLELSCKAFAPPAPRLSLVQEIVRDTMRHRFPGARLGVKSWPSLLQRHEQAAEAAEQWETPACFPESEDEAEPACEALCDEHKDEGCLREQRAAISRLMVAKLNQATITRHRRSHK